MAYFRKTRPPLGDRSITIALDEVSISLGGLDDGLAERLLSRYAPYASASDGASASLRVRLFSDERPYFIDPPDVPEVNPVLLACDGRRVRYLGYQVAGWFDSAGGEGQIVLARGTFEPDVRAIENYVRSATAWLAAERGGALVHAASAVLGERGYLFYGPSGAGKSTLSACNTRARILSDDLSLVLPAAGGGLDLTGSPFRGTYTGGPPVVGRFTLVAGFRIVKAPFAEVRSAPRVRVFAELVANLPFVVDAFPTRPDLFERFERTFANLQLSHLHFRKDDSYWEAIAAAGL